MKTALIAPFSTGPLRGNITTVTRISSYLSRAGVEVLVLPADVLTLEEMHERLQSFSPEVVHAFHARYCGNHGRLLAELAGVPSMITITGSDLHDPQLLHHPLTLEALHSTATISCFTSAEADKLGGLFPLLAHKIAVIPQGVETLEILSPAYFGFTDETFVVLLPAALRPVKRIEFAITALAGLVEHYPMLRLVIAGGVIAEEYAATITTLLARSPHAVWLGEVPRQRLAALYRRADVVLNCSHFESMPNTVMEAMALGRPLLAADIAGNRGLVTDGKSGLLFQDRDTFISCLTRLISDAELRRSLGEHAAAHMHDYFSPQLEAERYEALYRSLNGGDST